MDLGSELRRIRKRLRLTLVEVNKETQLSVSFLSDVERGRTRPSLDTLEKLAKCYQMTVNDLLKDADLGSKLTSRQYPSGFEAFLRTVGTDLDEEMKDLLLRVENRATRQAETAEDWMQIYYSLKSILGR